MSSGVEKCTASPCRTSSRVAVLEIASLVLPGLALPDWVYPFLQFTDGLHEEILNRLAGVQAFHLIARTSVMRYRDRPKPVRLVAQEVGVDVVLEGSVRRAGQQLRITVQLIDARSEGHIWSDTYDTEYLIEEVFSVQSEIASSVTRELQVNLGATERRTVERRPTSSLAAYEAFVRGRRRRRLGRRCHGRWSWTTNWAPPIPRRPSSTTM